MAQEKGLSDVKKIESERKNLDSSTSIYVLSPEFMNKDLVDSYLDPSIQSTEGFRKNAKKLLPENYVSKNSTRGNFKKILNKI